MTNILIRLKLSRKRLKALQFTLTTCLQLHDPDPNPTHFPWPLAVVLCRVVLFITSSTSRETTLFERRKRSRNFFSSYSSKGFRLGNKTRSVVGKTSSNKSNSANESSAILVDRAVNRALNLGQGLVKVDRRLSSCATRHCTWPRG